MVGKLEWHYPPLAEVGVDRFNANLFDVGMLFQIKGEEVFHFCIDGQETKERESRLRALKTLLPGCGDPLANPSNVCVMATESGLNVLALIKSACSSGFDGETHVAKRNGEAVFRVSLPELHMTLGIALEAICHQPAPKTLDLFGECASARNSLLDYLEARDGARPKRDDVISEIGEFALLNGLSLLVKDDSQFSIIGHQ